MNLLTFSTFSKFFMNITTSFLETPQYIESHMKNKSWKGNSLHANGERVEGARQDQWVVLPPARSLLWEGGARFQRQASIESAIGLLMPCNLMKRSVRNGMPVALVALNDMKGMKRCKRWYMNCVSKECINRQVKEIKRNLKHRPMKSDTAW